MKNIDMKYVKERKKQCNRIFMEGKLAIKVIMDWRTTPAHKSRIRLGFKRYNIILTKEQSVLTKIMSSFEGENIQTQYNALNYRIDLYFHDWKVAKEIDEDRLNDMNIDYEIKRQKTIEQELGLNWLDLILIKKTLIFLKLSMKYLDALNNRLKNSNRKNFNEIIRIRFSLNQMI